MVDSGGRCIWVVEDDPSLRWVLEEALGEAGLSVVSYEDAQACREALDSAVPDCVVTDIRLPGGDGLELLDRLREAHPALPVIVITAHSDLEHAVEAYRRGAFEYLPKPFDVDDAVDLIRRAAAGEAAAPREGSERSGDGGIIGQSPAMQAVFRAIGRLAGSSMPVLIEGESGTGKELVAQALHRHSPRTSAPFVALNTAAIPSELLESELFGHERGAFTGADARRRGRFEEADGGTLFLDEIGDMPHALQTRLLRVLAEGEFYRVGGQTPLRVDVRILAATHQDLEAAVREGRFREDLLHRLDVIRIQLPPLRDRPEDVPELLEHYLDAAAKELGTVRKHLSEEAAAALAGYEWRGNVRELVNLCRRLTVLAPGREIHLEDLPPRLAGAGRSRPGWAEPLRQWAVDRLEAGEEGIAAEAQAEMERNLIRAALARTRGHRRRAAALLGWGRNTLTRKIRELGLEDGVHGGG